jgi:transposase-like protein
MAVDQAAILEALRRGDSQNAVARRFGCGPATVNRIAKRNGLEYSAPKHAAEARRDYAAAERIALLNQGFEKARELLPVIKSPQWLQAWSISMGILIDKRRLEDGEATSRAEFYGDDVRDRLASRLDELAARRRQKAGAG